MAVMNGEQLYGFKRLTATLKMAGHPELRGLGVKQKLALNYASKASKITRLGDEYYTNTFTPYYPSTAYDRYLAAVKRVASGEPLPVVTNFAVTAKCCCDCWHCSFADRDKRDKLTLDVMRDSIAQIQDMGTSVIGLTGGEPLLRKDLEEIIACIDERSMPIFFTTGFQLTRERVRELKSAGLKIPVISLDHYTAEVHDKGRGRKGMFETALEAIRLFREEGFYVAVSFVPDRNLVGRPEELWKTLDFIREQGVNDMRLTSPILSGNLTSLADQKLTPEQVRTIFDVQRRHTATPGRPNVFAYDFFEGPDYYGCGAGYHYMFIDSQGNICPCDFTMMSFGAVFDRPIAETWHTMSNIQGRPARKCYANTITNILAGRKSDTWPLQPAETLEVTQAAPLHDGGPLPEFWRRMGLKPLPPK